MARKKVGEILVKGGYLTFVQVTEILLEQERRRKKGEKRMFGEIALELRHVGSQQLKWALAEQGKGGVDLAALGGGLVKVALAFLVVGALYRLVAPRAAGGSYGKGPAGAVSLVKGDGAAELAKYKGKAVLLNFWATWCPPCREEIPALVMLHRKYEAKGFAVVGMSIEANQGSPGDVAPFLRENGVNYPVMLATPEMVNAWGGLEGVPTSMLLDRQGKEAQRYLGPRPFEVFEQDLLKVL